MCFIVEDEEKNQGRIAQLVEPSAHNRSVVGSNPTAPTINTAATDQKQQFLEKTTFVHTKRGEHNTPGRRISIQAESAWMGEVNKKGTLPAGVPFFFS
jgi:hypothetical protein